MKRNEILLIFLLMIVGAGLRFDYLFASDFVIDSDEAIVGLMAKHINEGHRLPVFYYGQHYMGSLEAILASVSFYFFGVSNLALKLVPLLFALALIPGMYVLGAMLGGVRAGRIAALLTAVPPSTMVLWSTKARGGFAEILFIGLIALIIALKNLSKERPSLAST
ncbi:MAG: hypothetical protein KDD53_10005, partial [Bdellovibrionales bacterium]|nr:hypothetical protein [Bdellovibrionales bacterium]